MITIDFASIKVFWWGWILAGFIIGAYLHFHLLRHWLHILAIGILRGIIWMLRKTDFYYKPPVIDKPKPDKVIPATTRHNTENQLADLLSNNPDISIRKIHDSL